MSHAKEPASPPLLALGVARDLLDEPRAEPANLRLGGRGGRLDQEIRPRPDYGLVERRDQRSRLDQGIDEGLGADRDALGVDCRLNHLLVVGELQRSGEFQLSDAQCSEPRSPVHERFERTRIIEMQQYMARQIRRPVERPRTVAKQRRTAYRENFFPEEPDGSFRHRFGRPVADGEVDQAALQIERLGGGRDAHVNAGMEAGEARQARNEPKRSKSGSRGDGKLARPIAGRDLVDGGLQALEHVGRDLLESRSLLGEDERPRAPLEQPHSQMLLPRLDLPAYGGLRNEQLLRSPREAQVARRRLKSLEESQRWQPIT